MKKKSPPRPYWQLLVKIFYDFYREKFGESPCFDGSAPRDMGVIIDQMKNKADEKNIEWTENVAKKSWTLFLEAAYRDKWLNENFLMQNLNRQKDKIFLKIKEQKNGSQTNQRVTTTTPGRTTKSTGAEKLVGILKSEISSFVKRTGDC